MMKNFFTNLYIKIRKIEGDSVNLNNVPYSVFLGFLLRKGCDFLRGVIKFRGLIFVGNAVRVKGKRYISVGKFASIGSQVLLEGFSSQGLKIGVNVTIDDFAILKCSGAIREQGVGIDIGPRSSIGIGNYLHGGGGINIGSDCLFGPNVKIISSNHIFSDTHNPIRLQGELGSSIEIADNVWIGAGAIILAGVSIGEGAIVGAGALVTRNVLPGQIVVGNPAKPIRNRK
jgi:acetyltransferase-like isoleucine patch superfamily enzyme